MDVLIDWLLKNILLGDKIMIVYGDYCFDNMILYLIELKVIVVFDWEFCIFGDLLVDFIYYLMNWIMLSSDLLCGVLVDIEDF